MTRRTPLPDYLLRRPTTIRAALHEQALLGDACVHLVEHVEGRYFKYVMPRTRIAFSFHIMLTFHCDTPFLWDTLFSFLLAGEKYYVPKSEANLRKDHRRSILSSIPFETWRLSNATTYLVDLARGVCSCSHFVLTNMPCKHMFAALKHSKRHWSYLPPHLLDNPRFNIDYKVGTNRAI